MQNLFSGNYSHQLNAIEYNVKDLSLTCINIRHGDNDVRARPNGTKVFEWLYAAPPEMGSGTYTNPSKDWWMTRLSPYVSERLCLWPASCLTDTSLSSEGRCSTELSPVGGEECVSSHHVHRLPVTLPYAPAAGLLITSACDSRTARVARTRRLGGGGWGRREGGEGGREG